MAREMALMVVSRHWAREKKVICSPAIKAAASNQDPLSKKLHRPSLKCPGNQATQLRADARQQTSM